MRQLPQTLDPNLLIGYSTGDDAAVYRLQEDLALVQTVDFFPPVVDDPYDFGSIAVANALSDIYAMGGKPLLGLNIVCFPVEGLPLEILFEILRGGLEKAKEAGVLIVGGHTIDDPEPKYGLAATGTLRPGEQTTNAGAKPGDHLILTKPLGMGIITTGIKQGVTSEATTREAVRIMGTLNKAAAEAMQKVGVSACTDITGYGLLGHLLGMAKASGVQATVYRSQVPVLEETWTLAEQGVVSGGTGRNLAYLEDQVDWHGTITETEKIVLVDAQTSGGLLIAVPAEKSEALQGALKDAGVETVAHVGECAPAGALPLRLLP